MKLILTVSIFLVLKAWETLVVPSQWLARLLVQAARGVWPTVRSAGLTLGSLGLWITAIILYSLDVVSSVWPLTTWTIPLALLLWNGSRPEAWADDWQAVLPVGRALRWWLRRFPLGTALLVMAAGCLWLDYRGVPQWLQTLTGGHQALPAYEVRVTATNVWVWENWHFGPADDLGPDGFRRVARWKFDDQGVGEYLANRGAHHSMMRALVEPNAYQVRNLRVVPGWHVGAHPAAIHTTTGIAAWHTNIGDAEAAAINMRLTLATSAPLDWAHLMRSESPLLSWKWVRGNTAPPVDRVIETDGLGLWMLLTAIVWLILSAIWVARHSSRKNPRRDFQAIPWLAEVAGTWLRSNWRQAKAIETGAGSWPWAVKGKKRRKS